MTCSAPATPTPAARSLAVGTHRHPLPGQQGELLAIDVVRDGPSDADALLLTTSAVHGLLLPDARPPLPDNDAALQTAIDALAPRRNRHGD